MPAPNVVASGVQRSEATPRFILGLLRREIHPPRNDMLHWRIMTQGQKAKLTIQRNATVTCPQSGFAKQEQTPPAT